MPHTSTAVTGFRVAVKKTTPLAALSPGVSFGLLQSISDVCRDESIMPKTTHFDSKSWNREVARDTVPRGHAQGFAENLGDDSFSSENAKVDLVQRHGFRAENRR
jgi:hypothetical protein